MINQIVTMPAASEAIRFFVRQATRPPTADRRDLLAGDPADAVTAGEQVDRQRRQDGRTDVAQAPA